MPYDSDYRRPMFIGKLVYRSRVNDIINMSDSNRIGSFSIAELNTQYNNVTDLDAIQSRTFDADSDGTVRGFTDFSNTINTMDENHWLQIDSDGYGNNMLGYQLDFAPEKAGIPNPPIYNIAPTNLLAGSSTTFSISISTVTGTGSAVCQSSTVDGLAGLTVVGFGILEDALSTVVSTAERIVKGSGILIDGSSTAEGTSERTIDTISADLLDGSATTSATVKLYRSASGTLLAQPSDVDGVVVGSISGIGILLASSSVVNGTGLVSAPYVGMPFPQVYVGMPSPAIYVGNIDQPE